MNMSSLFTLSFKNVTIIGKKSSQLFTSSITTLTANQCWHSNESTVHSISYHSKCIPKMKGIFYFQSIGWNKFANKWKKRHLTFEKYSSLFKSYLGVSGSHIFYCQSPYILHQTEQVLFFLLLVFIGLYLFIILLAATRGSLL